MRYRRESEPSPLRTGLVHAGFSLTVFGGLAACFGLGVHLTGDPATASPRKTIALFGPSETAYAYADTSAYSYARQMDPDADGGAELVAAAYEAGAEEGFALTYTNLEGEGLRIDVTGGQGGPAPQFRETGVRINGRMVQPGQSFGEVRGAPVGGPAAPPAQAVSAAVRAPEPTGRSPADLYARPFSNPEGRPVVSLVIGGLGINATQTLLAIETLPPDVTLSFAPDANRLDYWIRLAREAGHEVLIEVPMEAQAYDRLGMRRDTLMADAAPQANLQRLNQVLGRARGYYGVINYQGAKFAADPAAVEPVFRTLAERQLAFIDDGTLETAAFARAASTHGLRYVRASGAIDTRQTQQDIAGELMELEMLALQHGAALGAAFAFPVTIETASNWIEQLPEKGLILAPASALLPRAPAQPAPVAQGRELRTGSLRGSGVNSGG
ncbi:divergent polysaccharide deacetylase family protein [Hyphomonas sp.]|uniref:divergent polysaccharide deacetylase family protein n=1 Tax=Hyphomonas sp. TaxID=87 RepID=UPI00391CA2E5